MSKWMVSVLFVAALIAAGGCRKASESLVEKLAEKAIEKQGGGKADVKLDKGTFTVKTKEGKTEVNFGDGAKIPADFPKDVFVVKGGKVLNSVKVPEGFAVTMEIKDTLEKLAEKCGAEMKAQGWTEAATANMGEQTILSYSKEKDNRTANFVLMKSGDVCQVHITAVKEKSGDTAPAVEPTADAK